MIHDHIYFNFLFLSQTLNKKLEIKELLQTGNWKKIQWDYVVDTGRNRTMLICKPSQSDISVAQRGHAQCKVLQDLVSGFTEVLFIHHFNSVLPPFSFKQLCLFFATFKHLLLMRFILTLC